jgi:ribonuclease III
MDIEKIISYTFKDKKLLDIAITHSSYAHENNIDYYNERIEYLGDAVLELIASEFIYKNYPDLAEGEMTKARAYSVCEESLAELANNYGFSDFLKVGKCEAKKEGKYRSSILADAVEAIIGAIFLDGGLEKARSFIISHISKQVEICVKDGNKDYKTKLQEKLQVNGDVKIEYKICGSKGPEHNKIFIAEVYCNNKFMGRGEGKNKKEAEMEAAKEALK